MELITGNSGGTITVHSLRDHKKIREQRRHSSDIIFAAVDRDRRLLTNAKEGTMRISTLEGEPLSAELPILTEPFDSRSPPQVLVSQDGKFVATLERGRVRVWHTHWTGWLAAGCRLLRNHPFFRSPERAEGISADFASEARQACQAIGGLQ
jgi:hypothetical protein